METIKILDRAKEFPLEVPEFFNYGYDIVDEWARRDRNKVAMLWVNQKGEEKRYTFHDLSRLSNQAANFLLKLGVGKGDRAMLMLPRLPEWWIFSLALIKLGAVQCPSPVLLTPVDLLYRMNAGRFKIAITDLENAEKFDEIADDCPTLAARILVDGTRLGWESYSEALLGNAPPSRREVKTPFTVQTRSDAPMIIVFTSGTSKYPKIALHSYDYPLGHLVTGKYWQNLNANDVHMTISDTGWAKNYWGNYLPQWIIGACVLVYDVRGKFHADELLPLLEKYEVSSFCAPPTVYRMLVLNDLSRFDFRDLRSCTAAGEPLHEETVRLWRDGTGLTLREGYGQTETCCMIAEPADAPPRIGSMGKAAPGWDIEIHDDEGTPLPAGEEGRIALRIAPNRPVGLLRRYLYGDEENAKAFVGDFYYTGDRASCDKDGFFWFAGRSDDMIKSSGYRIGPSEVEEVLMQHPSVLEVAVVGAPDPMRGALVKAYIVLKSGFVATAELVKELQHYVKNLTAPYKYPREIDFVKSLPKTFSGKIKRDLLRRHAETGETSWEDAP